VSLVGLGVPGHMGEHDTTELIGHTLISPFVLAPPSLLAVEKALRFSGVAAVDGRQGGLFPVVSPGFPAANRVRRGA
jgi:hypothetical protein